MYVWEAKGRALAIGAGLLTMIGPAAGISQTGRTATETEVLLAVPAAPDEYQADVERARQLIEEQKWNEAEGLLRRLTAQYPLDTAYAVHASTWGRLATALRQQGKHREAIDAYRRVMALQGPGLPYPGPANARYWIAVSQVALGQTDAAMDTLQTMVSDDSYFARPDLLDDDNFAALRHLPRFRAIAGDVDVSGLSRETGWQRDIDHLLAELRRSNPGNSPIPDAVFERAASLKAEVPRLNDHEVALGMLRLLAPLERGHTGLWLGAPGALESLDFRPFPVRLYVFPEGVFVTEGWNGQEDLAGAQVVSFGRVPALEAVNRIADATSRESPIEALWLAPMLLNRPGVLKGLGMAEHADRAELTLKLADGRTVTRTIHAADEPPPDQWRRKLNPPANVPPPLFLRNIREAHWIEAMPRHDAVYLQVNNMVPDEDETLAEFGLRARREIAAASPRNVIVDLRHNNGGNSFQYVELLRTLTAFSAQEGHRVYALIGRGIYSAAANFTTDLERIVRPTFVGEPTSATGNQWGDESTFRLPYSGLRGSLSGARWQLSHPWDERRSIVPQVPVQLTAEAYFEGRDPALEMVLELIERSTPNPD